MPFPSSGVRRAPSNSSQASRPPLAGILLQKDSTAKVIAKKSVFANKELIIGRDRSKCQWTIDDAQISRKHLRIYSVVYDNDDPTEVDILVYAEDLSHNGTFWNGSHIGKGNGGFLLSQDDALKLSPNVYLTFQSQRDLGALSHFDLVQENEMKKFRSSFIVTDRLLGSGAFGRVFLAIEQRSRYQLACKIVDLRKLRPSTFIGRVEEPAAAEDVDNRAQLRKVRDWGEKQKMGNKLEDKLKIYFREVEILSSLSHPNIIGLEMVFITDNTLYIFEDLITAGDLFSYIESKNGKLLEVEAAVVIRQILLALCYLHENNIVHRDLKPDNILMTSLSAGCRVVLTDFGAARRIRHPTSRMSSVAGTDEYAAPEVFGQTSGTKRRSGYTRSVDLWSLGCVAVVLLTGGSAFFDPKTNSYSERLASECNLKFLHNSHEWQQVRQRPAAFVERLLVLDEDHRMTAPEALEHEWFSNEIHKTNFEELYQRTIKHWRPRNTKRNRIELQEAYEIQHLNALQALLPERKSPRFGPDAIPQDAHLKPPPTKMFRTFYPPKKFRNPLNSPEVSTAIEEYWTDFSQNYELGKSQIGRRASQRETKKQSNVSMEPPTALPSSKTPHRLRRAVSASPQMRHRPGRDETFRLPLDTNVTSLKPRQQTELELSRGRNTPQRSGTPRSVLSSDFDTNITLRPGGFSTSTGSGLAQEAAITQGAEGTDGEPEVSVNMQSCHSQLVANHSMPSTPLPATIPLVTGGLRPQSNQAPEIAPRHRLRRLSSSFSPALAASKRRRVSIFDIEEEIEDALSSNRSPSSLKKHRRRTPLTDEYSNTENNENADEDTTITLPHHTAAFTTTLDSSIYDQDLYLPR